MTEDAAVARALAGVKHEDDLPHGQYPDRFWGGRTELVAPLVEVLSGYDDPTGRGNAAKALGYVGDEGALDPLVSALGADPSAAVRRDAAWGLRALGDPEAVPALREAAETDPDGDVRWQAGRTLATLDWPGKPDYAVELATRPDDPPPTRPPGSYQRMAAGSSDRDAWPGFVRELRIDRTSGAGAVRTALCERVTRDAATPRLVAGLAAFEGAVDVLRNLLDHPDPGVRRAALEGVADHGDDGDVPTVERLAETDPDESVRAAAVEALAERTRHRSDDGLDLVVELPDRLGAFLDADAAAVRQTAASELRFADPAESVPRLLEVLADADADVRATAAWGLKVAGLAWAVPDLLERCSDDDPSTRENAYRALAWVGGDLGSADVPSFELLRAERVTAPDGTRERSVDPEAVRETLVAGLSDPVDRVAGAAARALSVTDDSLAATLLADHVRDGSRPESRSHAVAGLSRFAPLEPALDGLRAALSDPAPSVRAAAVRNVRALPDDEARTALVEALADDAPQVREAAAGAAGHPDDDAVERALRRRLDDDPAVEYAARSALDEF